LPSCFSSECKKATTDEEIKALENIEDIEDIGILEIKYFYPKSAWF
jgi:hypothetical protein